MTAWRCVPVGADGVEPERAELVYGPDLDRIRLLLGQLDAAAVEIADLERQLRAAERAAEGRDRDAGRLRECAVALSQIAHRHPEAAGLVEGWREVIWGTE